MRVTVGGHTFGDEDRDALFLTDVEPDLGEVRTGDVENPLRHGSRPGTEFLAAGTVTLTLCTNYGINDSEAADAEIRKFMRAWRAGLSAPPGEMVPMYVMVDGINRVVFGRPGRASPSPPGSADRAQGIATVLAEFRVLDPLVYDPDPAVVSISVVPRSLGGIVAPIVTPVTTTMTSDTSYRHLSVGGDGPAPLRVIFHGPATDPRVRVGGVEVGVTGQISWDEEVVVDGRDRSVSFADGRPAAARLSRRSRVDRLRVDPGSHELSFTATDRTGTARVTVEATPTYYHL